MELTINKQDILTKELGVLRISDTGERIFRGRRKQTKPRIPQRIEILCEFQMKMKNLLLKHIEPHQLDQQHTEDFVGLVKLTNQSTGQKKFHLFCYNMSNGREVYDRIYKRYKSNHLSVENYCSRSTLCGLSLFCKIRHNLRDQKWNAQGSIVELVSVPENYDLRKMVDDLHNEERFRFIAYMMFLYQLEKRK